MSYTQRLSTSLGPGQAYIHSAQDPGTLTPTADVFEGVHVCVRTCTGTEPQDRLRRRHDRK